MLKPERRALELEFCDLSFVCNLDIGFGVIEVMGQAAGGTLVFAGETEESLLGVTVLESAGFAIDPQRERLVPRRPKRKRGPGG